MPLGPDLEVINHIYSEHINRMGGHIYSYILGENLADVYSVLLTPLMSKSYIDTVLIIGDSDP